MSRRGARAWLAGALLAGVPAGAACPPGTSAWIEAQACEVAARGLLVVAGLQTEGRTGRIDRSELGRLIGFSAGDFESAGGPRLRRPIPMMTLDFEEAFHLADPTGLRLQFEASRRSYNGAIFPLEIDGEVRSSISVQKGESGWRLASIGRRHLVASLLVAERAADLGDGTRMFALEVPEFYQLFLVAYRPEGRELAVIPVYDDPRRRFAAAQRRPAVELLCILEEDWALYDPLGSDKDLSDSETSIARRNLEAIRNNCAKMRSSE